MVEGNSQIDNVAQRNAFSKVLSNQWLCDLGASGSFPLQDLERTGFRLEFIPMKIGAGMTFLIEDGSL